MTDLQAAAQRFARSGAQAVLSARRNGFTTQRKTRHDIVTGADRASEAAIRNALARERPADAVVGEEDGGRPAAEGLTWWIDPLDGTHNFAAGSRRWCVSVAVCDRDGVSLAAAVAAPDEEVSFGASRGRGALCNDQPLRCEGPTRLSDALVASGFGHRPGWSNNVGEWGRVAPRVRGVRCSGSAALDLCDIARGQLDGYWEQGLAGWDTAAGALIAREAGAVVVDLHGHVVEGPVPTLMAAAPTIADELMHLLRPDQTDPRTGAHER